MPFDGLPVSHVEPRLGWSDLPFARVGAGTHVGGRRERARAVLFHARELLADERQWCRHSFARTWFGIPVSAHSRLARRYCALGAIMRAANDLGLPFGPAVGRLQRRTGRLVPSWNDDPRRNHAEVLAAFDAAIGAAQA